MKEVSYLLNTVFRGRLSELMEEVRKGKIGTELQGTHTRPCKFWTALKVLSGVRNSIVIAHGPRGCAYGVKRAYKLTNCRNSGTPYEAVVSTNMDVRQIVYGGEKELRGAILEVDRKYKPDVIFVATSCASGIIGDNVDAVVKAAQSEVRAELVAVHCEGFSGEYRSGFDLAFEKLVELMEEPTPQSREELSDSVNIVGGRMGPERTEVDTDVKELIRLVRGMGAKVNAVIAGYCTLEELRRAPSVAVNCTRCLEFGYVIGMKMLEKFGTPLNSTILPYGIAATERWIKGAAEHLGMEEKAERLMEEEYDRVKTEFERAKENLGGMSAIVEGHDAVRALAIAHMLEIDFGMDVVIYNFHPWSTKAKRTSIDYVLETGMDPEIVITEGTITFGKYESMKQLEEELLSLLELDGEKDVVYFGSSLSFPSVPLVDLNAILNRPRFGYRGALRIAKCINTAFKRFRALKALNRPLRSRLFREMVYPRDSSTVGCANLALKMACEVPDPTIYARR